MSNVLKHFVKFNILMAALCCYSVHICAQKDTRRKIKHEITVKRIENYKVSGVLYDASDNMLQLYPLRKRSFSRKDYKKWKTAAQQEIKEFSYVDVYASEIEKVTIRSKRNIILGFSLGFAAGAITGVIIGLNEGDTPDPPPCYGLGCLSGIVDVDLTPDSAEGKAAFYGVGLGLLGSVVGGTVVGLTPLTIKINGKRERYESNLTRLKKYTYLK